jgi:hypothetical protein
VSVGVGRLLPGLSGTNGWELKALGFGYGALSVALLVVGALRQHRVAAALRQGSHVPLSTPLVNWLTAAGSRWPLPRWS